MNNDYTEYCLGVFWEGEEVDGITVYAYYDSESTNCFSITDSIWPENDAFERSSKLGGIGWSVCVWDIKINKWPSEADWASTVKKTLNRAITDGAKISWCGLEGGFVDPPDLFDPNYMSGSVWAALTNRGELYFHSALHEDFKVLSDSELNMLHQELPREKGPEKPE